MAFSEELNKVFGGFTGNFSLKFTGDTLYIEGVNRIAFLSESKVIFACKKIKVEIIGEGLKVLDCGFGYAYLKGDIVRIEKCV